MPPGYVLISTDTDTDIDAGADTADGRAAARNAGGRHRKRRVLWIAGLLLMLPVAYVGFNAVDLWRTWSNVERETFDQVAFEELPEVPLAVAEAESLPAGTVSSFFAEPVPVGTTDPYETFMVVGSDEGDHRADVIMLALLPHDGSAPFLVSLPRDLYLPNRCTQGLTRINANFAGCGDLNGASQLSGAVEDFTGIEVDHFALFTMEGFQHIIDQIGGTEICVEHPVRDGDRLSLPAGCSQVNGEVALSWVRSRTTEEYVDGRWRTMAGVSDLTRNQRQQDLLLSMLTEAAAFDSPQELTSFAGSMGDAFTLDDQLGLREAVDIAWDNRHVRPDAVIRLTIPVQPYETAAGAQILLPTMPFAEVLAGR